MKWLSVAFFAFVGFVLFSATFGLTWFKLFLYYVPHGDKFGHFVLVGGLAFCANVLLKLKTTRLFNHDFLLGSLLVFIFMTFEEFSQIFIPTRNFDLLDLFCNYFGILTIGYLAYLTDVKRQTIKEEYKEL